MDGVGTRRRCGSDPGLAADSRGSACEQLKRGPSPSPLLPLLSSSPPLVLGLIFPAFPHRRSAKMASPGAAGAQSPLHMLTTAVHGTVRPKCDFNMENLSRPELLTLLSVLEGELEARDLVIETLRARRKEVFIQEQYGCVSLTDPFLALQRDEEARGGPQTERPALCLSPMAVLESLMGQCRRMRESMGAQLAAAENRERKLQEENQQLQSLEQEHRKLSAQLKEEREKNKLVVLTLVREYRHLATRAAKEAHRHDNMSTCLQEELSSERLKVQRMEARMEEQLSEMDTECGQLQARLAREEEHNAQLRAENSALSRQLEHLGVGREPKAYASVAVGTDAVDLQAASCQTEPVLAEASMAASKTAPLTIAAKPPVSGYAGLSLPKTHGTQRSLLAENGPCGSDAQSSSPPTPPVGVGSRIQATRYKFQASPLEPDQNGTTPSSPPSRDLSPSSRDSLAAKQQARNTVTQVLSRFTSPPVTSAVRPGLPHSTSEGGPFPGRLGHPHIGTKTPRGTPPPVPPKKPGLSQTPSPTQPCVKLVPEASRSPAMGGPLRSATPQLAPKPALELGGPVPALTTSQVGACPPQPRGPHQGACAECPPVGAVAPSSSSSIKPISASSCRPCETERPLAAASGWCLPVAPSPTYGGPSPLDNGLTLLLQAAIQGNVTLLSTLLNQDPNDEDGRSALFSAAQSGHADCVDLLLKAGVPTDVPHNNGFTPLHTAASNGHTRCVELLVPHVDMNRAAASGQTPLFLACRAGNGDCVRVLLDAGADYTALTEVHSGHTQNPLKALTAHFHLTPFLGPQRLCFRISEPAHSWLGIIILVFIWS